MLEIITGNGLLFYKTKNTRKQSRKNGHWKKKHLFSKLAINSGEITGIEHYTMLNLFVFLGISIDAHTQNCDFKLYLGHTPAMVIISMRFLFYQRMKSSVRCHAVVLIKFYGRCWYICTCCYSHISFGNLTVSTFNFQSHSLSTRW